MKVIAGGRQTGRTTEAIKFAKENDAVIVTFSKQAAEHVMDMDPDVKAMSIHSVSTGERGPFVIDNLLLTGLPRGVEVIGITVTSTDVVNTNERL